VKSFFGVYDLGELVTGAHCGCCGAWMGDEIVPECWAWSVCDKCISKAGEFVVRSAKEGGHGNSRRDRGGEAGRKGVREVVAEGERNDSI